MKHTTHTDIIILLMLVTIQVVIFSSIFNVNLLALSDRHTHHTMH